MNVKLLVVAACTCLCFILAIAAVATAYAVLEISANSETKVGLFQTCSVASGTTVCVNGITKGGCSAGNSAVDAARAFYVMTVLFSGIAAVFAICRIFVDSLAGGIWKQVMMVALVVVAVFGLIAWAIGFGLYSGEYCGVSLSNNSKYSVGPSAPLMLVAWVIWCVGGAAEFLMPDSGSSSSSSSDTP